MSEKKSIYESIPLIMQEIGAIGKDQVNKQQGFQFRGIDDVYNHAQPLFAKYKVFTVPFVLEERTEERQTRSGGNLIYRILTMQYRFYAEDGTYVEARVIGEGMDSGDKAGNKAMAVAHKYAILQVLQIPTEDMIDPDSGSPEASVPKPKSELKKEPTVEPEPKVVGKPSEMLSEAEFTTTKAFENLVETARGNRDKVVDYLKTINIHNVKDIDYKSYVTTWKYIRMGNGQSVS